MAGGAWDEPNGVRVTGLAPRSPRDLLGAYGAGALVARAREHLTADLPNSDG
jgi:hypothetical protein